MVTHPRAAGALRFGVFPSLEHIGVPFDVPSTVLDVGASRGQFAAFARWRWPQAHIICFEPVEEAAAILDRMARTFGFAVQRCALGSRDEDVQIHIATADDSSSVLVASKQLLKEHPEAASSRVTTVSQRRLDTVVDEFAQPCLLKIDAQGSEYDVLAGAAGALHRVDQVYVECSFAELYYGQALASDVVSLLREHDFEIAGVFNVVRDRMDQQVQADLLFSRRAPRPVG